MKWKEPDMFEAVNHGNKPFSIRVPSLVVTRGKNDRLNFLTAMWFTPTGAEPSRMIVAIQKRTLTYDFLLERGEFVMSAPTDAMMEIVVFGGYVSGRDVDKFARHAIATATASIVQAPFVEGCAAWLECRRIPEPAIEERYDLFVAEVIAAWADDASWDGRGWAFRDDAHRTIHHMAKGIFFATGARVE